MNLRISLLTLSLLAVLTSHAIAADPATSGALNVPANRIVGLWETHGEVSPCAGGSAIQVYNNLLFHAGGTVTENIPPGITARNPGLGTWSYDPATGWHTLHLRFDRYATGVRIGYSTVDRELLLTPDALQASGPVRATNYALDDSVISELCGEAVSDRLQ